MASKTDVEANQDAITEGAFSRAQIDAEASPSPILGALSELTDADFVASPIPPEPDPMDFDPPTSLYEFAQRGGTLTGASPSVGDSSEPPLWATVQSGIADRGRVSLELVPDALLWFDGLPDALDIAWAIDAAVRASWEAAGDVALPRPPGPEHGDSGEPLEPTDSEARAYAEILLRWAAAHTGDHAPRVMRAIELLTEAPREANPVELGSACYNAYQDDQGNTEFAHAWRELTAGQRMNWEAAALAVRDLVVSRGPREAPCPDTGYPCNQSCTARCAKTGEDRAPRVGEAQRQQLAAILCETFAHGRVCGEEPSWGLSETSAERSSEWLTEFSKEHKGLHAAGQAGYDWPAWEKAADYVLRFLGATPPAEPDYPPVPSDQWAAEVETRGRVQEHSRIAGMLGVDAGEVEAEITALMADRRTLEAAAPSEPVGPSDAQRYRAALEHIANGGLSPCLTFAELILAGHTLLDAHRADCARADRGEYTLPDPPPFAPGAPDPLLVPPAAAWEHALSGLAKASLITDVTAAAALLSVPAPKDGDADVS